ncbi:hypothetical protein [Vibrio sp.]
MAGAAAESDDSYQRPGQYASRHGVAGRPAASGAHAGARNHIDIGQ